MLIIWDCRDGSAAHTRMFEFPLTLSKFVTDVNLLKKSLGAQSLQKPKKNIPHTFFAQGILRKST